jgi:cobalt-zinc-cadmium efflux system outer membrane protein
MKNWPIVIILFLSQSVNGQQQLSLTLDKADSLFLKSNLLLLAQQYNIEEQDALIIQAKAYPNPTFTADINVVDPQNNETFHVNKTGEKAFSIEQLIILGGKRKTEINIARQNKKLAELEFDDLLRNLQYQLHANFFQLHQQQIVLEKFDRQLRLLDTLINSYETQSKKGNLPLKDVVRLKSVYLKINSDKSSLATEHYEAQRMMNVLLRSDIYIIPIITPDVYDNFNKILEYNEIKRLALENRPDLKISDEENKLASLNIQLQKRMAIPDVALNGSYDQRGGAFINQTNAGISMPLPLWNLNKGNIRAAQAAGKSSIIFQQQKRVEVEADVQAAWQSMSLSITEYNKVIKYYSEDFDAVFKGVNDNFQKRNISILEFVDFFESYNESLSEFERVRNHLAQSATQINYVTASKVF